MFLWVTSTYRHTRAKAWMVDSQWVSVLCLHGKVLVAGGYRGSQGQPTTFSILSIQHCPHSASFPTHFRISNYLQTRLHSFNKLDSYPSLVSSARKVLSRIWFFISLLHPTLGHSSLLGTCPLSQAPDLNQKRLLRGHRGCSFQLGLHNQIWAC